MPVLRVVQPRVEGNLRIERTEPPHCLAEQDEGGGQQRVAECPGARLDRRRPRGLDLTKLGSRVRGRERVAELDEASYRAPSGLFFGSIHATLNHILAIDLYYLDALEENALCDSRELGASISEIAEIMQMSRQSVYNKLKSIAERKSEEARRAQEAAVVIPELEERK